MSAPGQMVGPMLSDDARDAEGRAAARLYRAPIYLACTLIALLTNYKLRNDVSWDVLNYHLYAGLSAFHDRFSQDYFAAGPQSYFNPYAYAPFYLLVHAGLSTLQISSILAVIHSAILWLVYEVAIRVSDQLERRARIAIGLASVAFAYVNPILIQQFGTTFADITTAELVLAGLLLLMVAVKSSHLSPVLWAGVIIGVATGLKPTNAVHAAAGLVVALFVGAGLRQRLRSGAVYGATLVAGFLLVAAPWCYRLERAFGNPMFPLMNGIFRSPHFITEPVPTYRFIPDTLAQALWRPFEIVKPIFMIQEEMRAPDIRYALLACLAVAILLRWCWRRFRPIGAIKVIGGAGIYSDRILLALGCAFALDWGGWLRAAGNGRYFLPMACVAAVLVVQLLYKILSGRFKAFVYAFTLLFAVQGTQAAFGSQLRWNAEQWNDHWLDVVLPGDLATQPNLYFSMSTQSDAFMANYLPAGSGLIDLAGVFALSPDGANGARVASLIQRYAPHLRIMIGGTKLFADDSRKGPRASTVNAYLAPFGLHVDATDCQVIDIKGLSDGVTVMFDESMPARDPRGTTHLLSCRVVRGAVFNRTLWQERAAADVVLDRLEDACPKLFQPRRLVSEPFGRGWGRMYMNTDEIAWVSLGWLKFDDPVIGGGLSYLGREGDWLKAPQKVSCGRLNRHYYAKIVAAH